MITYNLEGNPALKLDADTIAGIFLGTIKKWNDPKIAANKPWNKIARQGHRGCASIRWERDYVHFHRLPE